MKPVIGGRPPKDMRINIVSVMKVVDIVREFPRSLIVFDEEKISEKNMGIVIVM